MEINHVSGVRSDISEMLSKIREMSNKSKVFSETNTTQASGFDNVLSATKNSIAHVNQTMTESDALKNSYIAGDSNVSMSQVILASQKSKLAFEGLLTVRNKILDAYKEIMNMPV
jgi:flagellar hook-basal body complex protein FliE